MKKLLIILLALVLLSSFAGTIIYLYKKSEEPPVVYATESPTVATIIKKTVATGSVTPRKEIEIKPQVSGIVDKLYAEPGNLVAEGDLIARIKIIPNMVTLSSAESRVNLARIAVRNTERDLERNEQLHRDGAIAEAVYQQFEMAHDNAREELTAALESHELIRKGASRRSGETTNTLVRSTIAGMVLEVPLEEGSSVIEANTFNDGTTIATVADMNELVFKGKVDESEVGKLKTGMELLLTIGAIDEETFKAQLEHIAPKGVEENGAIQFEIRAALSDHNGSFIRANLSANADIVLDRRDDVLSVNESLLQFEDGHPFVEVEISAQVFEKRTIETGLSDGIAIEVLSGLTEADKIKNAATAQLN